jgi:hypothetical protein
MTETWTTMDNCDKTQYLEEVIAALMKRMGLASVTITERELDELDDFHLLLEDGDDYNVHILPEYVALEQEKKEEHIPVHGMTDEQVKDRPTRYVWDGKYSWEPATLRYDYTVPYENKK